MKLRCHAFDTEPKMLPSVSLRPLTLDVRISSALSICHLCRETALVLTLSMDGGFWHKLTFDIAAMNGRAYV